MTRVQYTRVIFGWFKKFCKNIMVIDIVDNIGYIMS